MLFNYVRTMASVAFLVLFFFPFSSPFWPLHCNCPTPRTERIDFKDGFISLCSQLWLRTKKNRNTLTHPLCFFLCCCCCFILFFFMSCNNHLSRRKRKEKWHKQKSNKISGNGFKTQWFSTGNFTLHIRSTHTQEYSPHSLHFVNYLYCLVLWLFDDDFFISFAPFEAPQRALRQLCAIQREAEQESGRGRERERQAERESESISCASSADRLEPNASNMKNKKKNILNIIFTVVMSVNASLSVFEFECELKCVLNVLIAAIHDPMRCAENWQQFSQFIIAMIILIDE